MRNAITTKIQHISLYGMNLAVTIPRCQTVFNFDEISFSQLPDSRFNGQFLKYHWTPNDSHLALGYQFPLHGRVRFRGCFSLYGSLSVCFSENTHGIPYIDISLFVDQILESTCHKIVIC